MLNRVILAGLLILTLSSVAAARYILWKPHEKPPVSLQEAVALGDAEAGKREEKYHCIRATLAKTFSGGDWELQYASPEGKILWVSVGADKSLRVSVEGFEYF